MRMPKQKVKEEQAQNFIKFLGTAGARFVMIKQLRASGGIWLCCQGTNILVDPGPGCIVRCATSRPRLDPGKLDGIILTHRHLDHSGDVNVMIEAMTEGGFKKRGVVFCPEDTLGGDSVFLRYLLGFPEKFEILKPKSTYRLGNFEFSTSMPHIHPVTTLGLKFSIGNKRISLITDTRYFPGLADFYKGSDIVIVAVVFLQERPGVDHLCLKDVEKIIELIRPEKTIMTHFGMTMLSAKPHLLAKDLSLRLGADVEAANDGMMLVF